MRFPLFIALYIFGSFAALADGANPETKSKRFEADLGILETPWGLLQVYDRLRAVHTEPPKYPAEARRAHVQGEVIAAVLVDERGLVREVKVQRSSGNPGLDQAAISALSRWKYEGREKAGRYVTVQPMVFSLIDS